MLLDAKTLLLIVLGVILAIIALLYIKNDKAKTIITIISAFIFIMMIIVTIQKIEYKDNRFLNLYLYQLSSGSMAPTLKTNDYILIMKTDNYKVGDIVTYKTGDKTITHRIIEINGDKITTEGDSNLGKDESITKEMIIGKTVIHGTFLNAFVIFLNKTIIAFVTTFLVGQLFMSKPLKN